MWHCVYEKNFNGYVKNFERLMRSIFHSFRIEKENVIYFWKLQNSSGCHQLRSKYLKIYLPISNDNRAVSNVESGTVAWLEMY